MIAMYPESPTEKCPEGVLANKEPSSLVFDTWSSVEEFTSKCTYRNFAGLKELKTCTSEVYQPSASWAKQTCVLISLKSYNALPVHSIAALMICDTMKLCILHLAVYFSFNTYVYVYIYVKVNVDNPVILNNRLFYRMTSSFG